MNTVVSRIKRRRNRYKNAYRAAVCLFSLAAICLCGVYKAGGFFTAENLRDMTLGDIATLSVIPAREKNYVSQNKSLYSDELSLVEEKENTETEVSNRSAEGEYPIISLDMSSGARGGEVLIHDTGSGAAVDIQSVLSSPLPSSLASNDINQLSSAQKPLVLIIHTHATECYTDEGMASYSENTAFRSSDKSKNMVAVGKVLCDTLNSYKIPTIHCETLHDEADYNSSYSNSLESVKYYLAKYPSIKYVFDVHRDAIIRENGDLVKTLYTQNGENTAQVMTLVGTNSAGADHPLWRDNLNLALKLQQALSSNYDGFARPVNLRAASFNQQYAPGSLLFEIGSCGNTLAEAKKAAVNLGESLAKIILAN